MGYELRLLVHVMTMRGLCQGWRFYDTSTLSTMFRAPNPFEELVNKATDENLTTENWEFNLELCDRLASNDESDARKCIAAIQKRVVHRNANVLLYAITLTDTLSKNCGDAIHHEIASRAFMHTLSKVVRDPSTHNLVKQRILRTLLSWRDEYKHDDTLGLVADTVNDMREDFYELDEEPAPARKDESEDDELQRVLALSIQDQGGRSSYPEEATSVAGPSTRGPTEPKSSDCDSLPNPFSEPLSHEAPQPFAPEPRSARPSHVRALYDFEPDEPGELAFHRGDVIRVLDSVYEQWWRGELRHQVGIFPVNYVEALPDTTPDMIQQELELERNVFTHASDIHVLHARLQHLKPSDNFVDDDELQELYQRSLALRPKIVRLMDTYHTKVQELRSLNDKFVRARTMLDDLIQQHVSMQTTSPTVDAPQQSAPSPPSDAMPIPQEEEKRRLFERARAEVEEFQRQRQQVSQASDLEGLLFAPPP